MKEKEVKNSIAQKLTKSEINSFQFSSVLLSSLEILRENAKSQKPHRLSETRCPKDPDRSSLCCVIRKFTYSHAVAFEVTRELFVLIDTGSIGR